MNAVVFADDSSHLIYSGSDDKICKVSPFDLTMIILVKPVYLLTSWTVSFIVH